MIIIHTMDDLPRLLAAPLAAALRSSPVVVLTGARQTGKSTLVQRGAIGAKRTYVSLDDVDTLDRALREPDALVRDAGRLTLDEVQRSPELLLAVKRAVDDSRSPGRFLLTGSANLSLMKRVSESLAGRAVHLTLWPLTRRELLGRGSAGVWADLFRRGDMSGPSSCVRRMPPRPIGATWFAAAAIPRLPTICDRRLSARSGTRVTHRPIWSAISVRSRPWRRWWTSGG